MKDNHIFKTEAETILEVVLNPHSQLSHDTLIHSIKRRVGANKLNGFFSSMLAAAIILDYTANNMKSSVSNSHNNAIIAHIHKKISEISVIEYLKAHAENANYADFMKQLTKPWAILSPPETLLSCIPDISLALTQSLKTNPETSQFSEIFETVLIENNFSNFEQGFIKEALRLAHENSTKHSGKHAEITPQKVLDMIQKQRITHHTLIQSKRFEKWMHDNFNSENPSHYKMLAFLTGHPCYTPSTNTDPNSMMNLLTLAGKLAHVQTDEFENTHYIPSVKYHTWDSNSVLSSNDKELHESKSDALVRTIDEVAKKIGMDPLFLCNQAPVLMQINGWLTTSRDHTKKTPFGLALEHYAQIKENNDRTLRLARASQQKAELLAHLETLKTLEKEDAICIFEGCGDKFTYYFPEGKKPPYQPDQTECIDAARLCPTCSKYLCKVCKNTICVHPSELHTITCTKCNHKLTATCTKCFALLDDNDNHQLILCNTCYKSQCCTKCDMYQAKLRYTFCSATHCNLCIVCSVTLPTPTEQIARMCNNCIIAADD